MDTNPDAAAFSRAVAKAVGAMRRQRGWSQEVLATRMGSTAKMVGKIESGRHDMQLTTLWRVASALDVAPEALLLAQREGEETATVRRLGPMHGLARFGWKRVGKQDANRIPVLDLEPRAGTGTSRPKAVQVAYAKPPASRHLREDGLFLARLRGDSMEPHYHDGDWCLFSRAVGLADMLGRAVLVRETDTSGMSQWTLKRLAGVTVTEEDHRRVELASYTPAWPNRIVELDATGDVGIEAVVREVLGR